MYLLIYINLNIFVQNNNTDQVMQRCAQLCVISQMPFPDFVLICLLIISVLKCHKWYGLSVSKIM